VSKHWYVVTVNEVYVAYELGFHASTCTVVLVVQRFRRRTFDQSIVDLISGRGIIEAPRSTQPSIPPGLRRGVLAYVGLQVKSCDTILRSHPVVMRWFAMKNSFGFNFFLQVSSQYSVISDYLWKISKRYTENGTVTEAKHGSCSYSTNSSNLGVCAKFASNST